MLALKETKKCFKASPQLAYDSLENGSSLVLFETVPWSSKKSTEVKHSLIKALGIHVIKFYTLHETLET